MNTALLLTPLSPRFQPTSALQHCGIAPDGWSLVKTRPHQGLCADVLQASSPEGTHLLRIFDQGSLVIANAIVIPCHICDTNPEASPDADPFVDIEWKDNYLRIYNWYGIDFIRTETWNFTQRDGVWILASWDRSLSDLKSGGLWSEITNLESKKQDVEFMGMNKEFCSNASSPQVGCRNGDPEAPAKRSCITQDLSTDISRIIEYRNRDFACGIRALGTSEPSPTHRYEVMPLPEPDPYPEILPAPDFGASIRDA